MTTTAFDKPRQFVVSFLHSKYRYEFFDKELAIDKAVRGKRDAAIDERVWLTAEYEDGSEWAREVVLNAIGSGYEFL